MNFTLYIALLLSFSAITSALTESAKKILNEHSIKYSSNLLVCAIACFVGVGGTAVYYVLANVTFNAVNIICMILMGISVAAGAMVGYDKVVQTIKQLESFKR